MPELLWKAYIDFETEEGEREKARALYERLLNLSGHVKVWISYALFEATPLPVTRAEREELDEDDDVPVVEGDVEVARRVFDRAYQDLKSKGFKAERVALLESWKAFEEANGTPEDSAKVQGMFPIVSRKRKVDEAGQVVEGMANFVITSWYNFTEIYRRRLGHGLCRRRT